MIDTDKYEGHTLGPWKVEGAKTIIGAEDLRITVKGGTQRDKNLRLVADAPLLLAEVKRLRIALDTISRCHSAKQSREVAKHFLGVEEE